MPWYHPWSVTVSQKSIFQNTIQTIEEAPMTLILLTVIKNNFRLFHVF